MSKQRLSKTVVQPDGRVVEVELTPADEAAQKASTSLEWLVERLAEPASVRRIHLETGIPKKRLRSALHHLMTLGLVERKRLPGGGHVWAAKGGNE